MKKIAKAGAAMAVALLVLAGCAAGTQEDPVDSFNGKWFNTGDGRVVYCIFGGYAFSCDWENAK